MVLLLYYLQRYLAHCILLGRGLMMHANYEARPLLSAWRNYVALCKPRVVLLMLLTVVVGMYLATPGWVNLFLLSISLLGIGLCAGSAAAINHLVDKRI